VPRTRHGDHGTKLHRMWLGMRQRCINPNSISYPSYGGRGISICTEWDDYRVFKAWTMSHGYIWQADFRQELDRIDNDGNYGPNNCQWVLPIVNRRNTRATRQLTAFGETKGMSDWVDDVRCPVSYFVLRSRLNSAWDVEEAISAPLNAPGIWQHEHPSYNKGKGVTLTCFGETKTLLGWVDDPRSGAGVSYSTLHTRMKRGWPVERTITQPLRVYGEN
jgi:hypothetical protein